MTNDTPNESSIQLPLSRGYFTIIDPIDADLGEFKWSFLSTGYAYKIIAKINQKTVCYLLHRVILERVIERPLVKGEYVDHINRDKLDNRRSNLRIATATQNSINKGRENGSTSEHKGVCWDNTKKRWLAQIGKQNKNYYIGVFKDEKQAAKAYDKRAKELFGEFAYLNFPDELE